MLATGAFCSNSVAYRLCCCGEGLDWIVFGKNLTYTEDQLAQQQRYMTVAEHSYVCCCSVVPSCLQPL